MARVVVLCLLCMWQSIVCARNTVQHREANSQLEPYHSKYARYSASTLNRQRSNFRATSANSSGALLQAATMLPFAICASIDAAKDARQRNALCNDLLRALSESDAPAYEWQNYYSRCR